jgi:hypothetical protein
VWEGIAGAQLEGSIPLGGDRRNYDIAFAGVAFPNNLCPVGGRLLRDGETAVMPVVERARGGGRHQGSRARESAALEDAWIEAARAEYASVWAFLRMAAELTALGRPKRSPRRRSRRRTTSSATRTRAFAWAVRRCRCDRSRRAPLRPAGKVDRRSPSHSSPARPGWMAA